MFTQRSSGLTKVKLREEFFGLRTSKWSFEPRWALEEITPLENHGLEPWLEALRSEDGGNSDQQTLTGSHQTMVPSQMLFTFNTLLIYISLKTYQCIWVIHANATWRGWKYTKLVIIVFSKPQSRGKMLCTPFQQRWWTGTDSSVSFQNRKIVSVLINGWKD